MRAVSESIERFVKPCIDMLLVLAMKVGLRPLQWSDAPWAQAFHNMCARLARPLCSLRPQLEAGQGAAGWGEFTAAGLGNLPEAGRWGQPEPSQSSTPQGARKPCCQQ